MRKKVLFQTDFALAKTGFGRNAKAVLSYLYKKDKYDIVHYSCGHTYSGALLGDTPWKSIGTLPDNGRELEELNNNQSEFRMVSYGKRFLDKVISQEKPDIFIGIQDIWGLEFAIEKDWFPKISSVIWTTLDSLPILPSAAELAPKIKNYWIWSNFATKALNEMGHEHVKTMHGAIEDENFHNFSDEEKLWLRAKHSIPENSFVVGYVFRNQLRKSVPNLLEGYKIFIESNPQVENPKLLLHTNFEEGWSILKLAKEYGVPESQILATYVCSQCKNYEVKNYQGKDGPCGLCGGKDSQHTCGVKLGVNERQLNEVYNLMDVYCHAFTSGGQELPIQEAKLTELITLVTNYSCGEEMCQPEAHSLALDWSEYREHTTEFRKASTCPNSIAENLVKVYEMSAEERKSWGAKARQWTLENYSVDAVGQKIEEFLDSCPVVDKAIYNDGENPDPEGKVDNEIENNKEWIKGLYKNILDRDIADSDSGLDYWLKQMSGGAHRQDIENYFRETAHKEVLGNDFEHLLDDDKGKRILYVMPGGITDVFASTSLFKSIKDSYPECNLYVATRLEFFEILDGNPYIHKVIPYDENMDNLLWLEGNGNHEGYFEVAYLPHIGTHRMFTYQHNGKDKISYDLAYEKV